MKDYQDALTRSGFDHQLTYDGPSRRPRKPANRKRNIIWFNPPYSKSVLTNVGKEFLKLIDKHFPAHNKFNKIFNRSTVKVSYSCLPSMKSKINQHNKKILKSIPTDSEEEAERTCSCPRNSICPLENNCLEKDILYSAELSSDLRGYEAKVYKGICASTFKERLGNHKKSFNHAKYKTATELSKEIWRIKDNGGNFDIKWTKDDSYKSYTPEIGRCILCQQEKLTIARYDGKNLLNKQNEIISRCRHRWKFKLVNLVF